MTATADLVRHLEEMETRVAGLFDQARAEWQSAATEERSAIETRLKALEDVQAGLRADIEEKRRSTLPGSEPTKKDPFSMRRLVRAIRDSAQGKGSVEQLAPSEFARCKAMSSAVDSAGGFLIPEEAIPQVIERLKAAMVVYQLGAREMPSVGSPVIIPRLSGSGTAYWIGSEGSSITASDLTLQDISASPKTVAARVILSNQMLEMATPAADRLIEDDIVSELSIAMDKGALEGTGASGQPLGIINEPNVLTEGISATVTFAELVGFVDALAVANALKGKLGWALHPSLFTQIMKLKSENASAGTPSLDVTRHSITESAPTSILGYPYRLTTSFTATTDANSAIFANWDDLLVFTWGGIRLLQSNVTSDAMEKDQTHIRALARMDVGVRHPESFCVAA